MMLYRNTKLKVRSPNGDTDYFDIVAGVLQGDTLVSYPFITCLDYVLRTSIDVKYNLSKFLKKNCIMSYGKSMSRLRDYVYKSQRILNWPARAYDELDKAFGWKVLLSEII